MSAKPIGELGNPDRAALQEQLNRLFVRFFQHLNAGPAGRWLDLELTMPQLKMLLVVDWLGPLPMSQVAGRLGISVSAATGLIDRLVEHGLAAREHDVQDRRVVRVASTAAGQALVRDLSSAGSERLERVLNNLTTGELQHCVMAIESMNQAAEIGLRENSKIKVEFGNAAHEEARR